MTKQLKRAADWFYTLPEKIRIKAFDNTPEAKLNTYHLSLQDALNHSFDWEHTPEGTKVWMSIYDGKYAREAVARRNVELSAWSVQINHFTLDREAAIAAAKEILEFYKQ